MTVPIYFLNSTSYVWSGEIRCLIKALDQYNSELFNRSHNADFTSSGGSFAYDRIMARGKALDQMYQKKMKKVEGGMGDKSDEHLIPTVYRAFNAGCSPFEPYDSSYAFNPMPKQMGDHVTYRGQRDQGHDLIHYDDPTKTIKASRLQQLWSGGHISTEQYNTSLRKTYLPLIQNQKARKRILQSYAMEKFRNLIMNRHDNNQMSHLDHVTYDASEIDLPKMRQKYNIQPLTSGASPFLAKHLSEVAHLVGGKHLKHFGGFFYHKGDRLPFATHPATLGQGWINVGNHGHPIPSVVWHEMGHQLEFGSDELAHSARKFLQKKGDSIVHLNSIMGKKVAPEIDFNDPNTKDHELYNKLAVKGDFAFPYVGRYYGFGATEVVSTGLQHFHSPEAMLAFRRADPHHFQFTLGTAVGNLGKLND